MSVISEIGNAFPKYTLLSSGGFICPHQVSVIGC